MKANVSLLLRAGGALALSALLASCFPPRVPDSSVSLSFTLPAGETPTPDAGLRLAAIYTVRGSEGPQVKVLAQGYLSGDRGNVYLTRSQLEQVDQANCLPYYHSAPRTQETVSVAGAKSCDISFVAYRAVGAGDGPTTANVRYLSHDTYSYAAQAYSYSFKVAGNGLSATERGTRQAGWTLVRHLVINPSATPSEFVVTRDSAPESSLNLPLRLHAPTDAFTSMSLKELP
ncbi:hypothetical protein SAMN04488058_102238 [Deinococcus reticulitermitis]|uniref:Lipoprotein n=1 Tax=Deinococcus reticulitermitis TaxID=856736 RepID=A0A1H6UWG3_9DEIO|nr:hypothetical protein [Deinococcus reticulitermitis]SEI92670.1 hypothetical protein SAMN04488058_102238 [Deinococcus reticulitermitis]